MSGLHNRFIILVADDDADDRILINDALAECRMPIDVESVCDGAELLDYLYRRNAYAGAEMPNLIMLDLNMPRKNGYEALAEIRRDPRFDLIPIVVFTTSELSAEMKLTYKDGVNSFIRKPSSFAALVALIRTLGAYWSEVAERPSNYHFTA